MSKVVDLTGQTFDWLRVVSRAERPAYTAYTGAWWLCECKCGAAVTVSAKNLLSRSTRSCGCLRREMAAEKASRGGKAKRDKYGG